MADWTTQPLPDTSTSDYGVWAEFRNQAVLAWSCECLNSEVLRVPELLALKTEEHRIMPHPQLGLEKPGDTVADSTTVSTQGAGSPTDLQSQGPAEWSRATPELCALPPAGTGEHGMGKVATGSSGQCLPGHRSLPQPACSWHCGFLTSKADPKWFTELGCIEKGSFGEVFRRVDNWTWQSDYHKNP